MNRCSSQLPISMYPNSFNSSQNSDAGKGHKIPRASASLAVPSISRNVAMRLLFCAVALSLIPLEALARNEDYFNDALASHLNGRTEVVFDYVYNKSDTTTASARIRIDIVTEEYVIEGGLDKRSSLDSLQQAVFASTLSGKKPAVAIYDTDGSWGKYEHRIWVVAKELGIRYIWVSKGQVIEK